MGNQVTKVVDTAPATSGSQLLFSKSAVITATDRLSSKMPYVHRRAVEEDEEFELKFSGV